jgi:6-pyruvoyltetrahydropterin/6-carboxytetrahydropterin synthase
MTTCTRRIQFCAGHRVHGHESKCANPHGHNYVALITAQGELDGIGRVIDFSVLKDRIGGWIDAKWDHGFIYWQDDLAMCNALVEFAAHGATPKMYALPKNPTAENMARYLLEVVCPAELAGTGVRVVRVQLWETENCEATASL